MLWFLHLLYFNMPPFNTVTTTIIINVYMYFDVVIRYGGVGGAMYVQQQAVNIYLSNFSDNACGSIESTQNMFPQYASAGTRDISNASSCVVL